MNVEYDTPNRAMADAFKDDQPILLLPPDWPSDPVELEAKLLAFVLDVAFKGSAGRLTIKRTARSWCARYWGSDGKLCSTHNGRFAHPSDMRCSRVK